MIRYIIWDAGGTLFDTYPAVVDALRSGTTSTSAAMHRPNGCWRCAASPSRTGCARWRMCSNWTKRVWRRNTGQVYAAIGPAAQPPFPGVRRVCRYICEIGGQNFIVTHRARASLEALLDAHGMARYFTGLT